MANLKTWETFKQIIGQDNGTYWTGEFNKRPVDYVNCLIVFATRDARSIS
jgi:hypothetical protein